MINDRLMQASLGYQTYGLENSKAKFRGPRPSMSGDYCAFIGSTETYGKFIAKPFPQLLQDKLAVECVNFAGVNSGIELVLKDPAVQLACAGAKVTVIAVMGAHNLSNRLYRVHPRNNDRYIRASKVLQNLFPNVDFTEIYYTRHLLHSLRAADLARFEIVLDELKTAWVARMKSLIDQINSKVVLLWLADHAPKDHVTVNWTGDLGADPLFVDQRMLDQISPLVAKVVEVITSKKARQQGLTGMIYHENEKPAAKKMPGPAAHKEAAQALLGPLKALL